MTDTPIMFTARVRANHTKLWNADDIEELAALIFAGKSVPNIAVALGRSQEAVRKKAFYLDFLSKRTRRKTVSSASALSL